MPVIPVEAGPTCLALADAVEAVGIDSLSSASNELFQYLGIASGIPVVHKVTRGHPSNSLCDAIAIAVVDDRDRASVQCGEVVFEIVAVGVTTRCRCVAVQIVC